MTIALIIWAAIAFSVPIGYYFVWKPIQFRRRRRAQIDAALSAIEYLGKL